MQGDEKSSFLDTYCALNKMEREVERDNRAGKHLRYSNSLAIERTKLWFDVSRVSNANMSRCELV